MHLTSPKHYAEGPPYEEFNGYGFHRTPSKLSKLPVLHELSLMQATEQALYQLAKEEKPDILHAHSPLLNGRPMIAVGKALKIPTVYEIRGFWEDAAVDHGTTYEGSLRYQLTRYLETRLIRAADAVTCICNGLRDDILARPGVDAEKISIIPNAVNIEQFKYLSPRDTLLEMQYDLKGAYVLGFLGSYYAYEGLDLLIHTLPILKNSIPNVKVLLVGGGPQEETLKQLAQELDVSDRVIFVGRVPQKEVPQYASLIDLMVFPRYPMRLTETVTPLKPLEAMAQGRLVLASDVGGHRELIEDGDTGWLFAAGNAGDLVTKILHIQQMGKAVERVREQGRYYVEQVRNWTNSVARYERVYARASENCKKRA
ncbi:MAG: hypothetical protein RLZZ502_1657 [Pseudomonadota bacterium]